jgi:glucose-1-phosphate adenylyltransferase
MSSYLMGSDYYETIHDILEIQEQGIPQLGVGNRCFIQNVIVDKNVRIGDDVRIIGGTHLADEDTPLYTIKEGIIVLKKGGILPNGFTMGA